MTAWLLTAMAGCSNDERTPGEENPQGTEAANLEEMTEGRTAEARTEINDVETPEETPPEETPPEETPPDGTPEDARPGTAPEPGESGDGDGPDAGPDADPDAEEPEAGSKEAGSKEDGPVMGLCERSSAALRAILRETGDRSCREASRLDLEGIRELSITYGPLNPGDLDGISNLRSLEIRELAIPLEQDSLAGLTVLESLSIHTQPPEAGTVQEYPVVTPGIFRDLGQLRELSVLGQNGWMQHELNRELLEGTPQLRVLEMHYLGNIEPDALWDHPELESISLHNARNWSGSPPDMPRGLLAGMDNIREVSISNFRWPPVIDLANIEAACAAREWRSHDQDTQRGRKPLGRSSPGN